MERKSKETENRRLACYNFEFTGKMLVLLSS